MIADPHCNKRITSTVLLCQISKLCAILFHADRQETDAGRPEAQGPQRAHSSAPPLHSAEGNAIVLVQLAQAAGWLFCAEANDASSSGMSAKAD